MMGKMEIKSSPGGRPRDGRHCDLCGCSQPAVRCDKCGCQIFCLSCDDMYHRHPKRRFHLRKAVDPITPVPQARPVLPVKVAHLNATNPGDPSKMPLPPPRKKKSSLFGSFRKPSPSSDNSPPLPKKEYSWTDRLGSIKKFMSNRPLPPLPTSDDADGEMQSTTNGESTRGDLSFIHRRTGEERPPQLPQRSPRSPDFQAFNQEKENQVPSSQNNHTGQMRNGSLELNGNHMNQNQEFPNNEENHWNNRMNNQNGSQAFGTLSRQNHQRGFVPPGAPGYPGGMHQSSSATDLHSLHNADGVPAAGPVPPHYPHYPMNPHMPPHYPYPMYHPQYPNYPQYFGNSFANLSHPPTSEGDVSDSAESASRHSSKKHQFRKRAKRSQSVMMDRMAYPGQYFPFGPYPGYGPWGAPMPMEAPPSPASSVRSLTRTGRSRRRKKTTSDDDDEDFSDSCSPMSRPKSSSSDPKEQPRAPLATQTTSSEYESDEEAVKRRNKSSTIRRQLEPISAPSPVREPNNVAKIKQSSSRQSDSDARGTPEIKSEKRPSVDSTTDSPQPLQQKSSTQPVPPDCWECKHCTFINPIGNRICQVCCKTATPRTETPVTGHSRPPSSAAAGSRKESVGSEMECSSPEKVPETEGDVEKKDRQDMASLNSALDEAEKQISRGLEELMKLKDDIDANISKEKPKSSENQLQTEAQETSKPVYKSSGRMRTSILDKLNLNKPQTANTSVSTSTDTQTGQSDRSAERIIQARRHSNSSTTSETYNSPLAQSPDLENSPLVNKQKRDSSCQTQQDSIAEYLEKRKAAEEAFLGRPINNFGFGYGDRMDMVTSPAPSMYDRFYGGGYGMMQRSHSRASLFASRVNDFGPMDYGGQGFGYGPTPMYRSVSRGSLTGEYPDGRMSEFHNLRKPDFYLSMEELVERRRQDNIRAQGLELVRMIREAEQQGFNADDIQVALTHCGKQNPMEWLQENWRNMVDSVLTLSSNYGNDKKENDIGLLSEIEARDALRLHKGNIWAAVTECVESRQRKYLELSARGNFARQDIVDALTSSDGDVEMAYAKLTKSTGKPFLMRIWGAGEGAQNQDGARPFPEDFPDGPRMYLKDETINSDEMSEEIWSEDGEWDEEDVYEDEREDVEELQTCHEDLFTSPQEMLTPESDRSDYCDAFPIDDRNASSPSDDIFFVIPEPKPEKKKGFLSKLSALRRDSKEQARAHKDDNPPEENIQAREDSISQKSNSSSEQPRNSGALSTLKNTLSAIKDTVTGGSKSDKKIPCVQPEKRTIIVKGKIDHESIISDSKDNVQLTSVKALTEDIVSDKNPAKERNEPTKLIENSSNKEQSKVDEIFEKPVNNQLHPDKKKSDCSSSEVEPKSRTEIKKPQSLAERLKSAKQTRSAESTPSTSAIRKESSTPGTKINDSTNTQTDKEKGPTNQVNKSSVNDESKDEIKFKTDTLNQFTKEQKDVTNKDLTPVISDRQHTPEIIAAETQNKVVTNEAEISTGASPTVQPQDIANESNITKNITSSKEEMSTKNLDSTHLKTTIQAEPGTSSKNKTKDVSEIKPATDNRPQSVSPSAKSPNKDKLIENSSHSNSVKGSEKNNASKTSNKKPEDEHKSDNLKMSSNLSDNKVTREITKPNGEIAKKPQTLAMEQVPTTSLSVENVSVTPDKETGAKESISKVTSKTDKIVYQTSNTHLKESNSKVYIPQTLSELSKMPSVSEDTKGNHQEASLNQSDLTSNILMNENISKNLMLKDSENQITGKSHDSTESTAALQTSPAEEASMSTNDNKVNASEELDKNQSKTSTEVSEVVLTGSEVEPNEITSKNLKETNESEISTKSYAPKSEVAPGVTSSTQKNEETEVLLTSVTPQNIPENITEQVVADNSNTHEDFNKNALEAEINTPQEASELHKTEPINTNQILNDTETKKDIIGEQISDSPQTSIEDASAILSDNKTNSPPTSMNESGKHTKSGKIKSNSVSKSKKMQENDKKEPTDNQKTEDLKTSPLFENKDLSAVTENANKIANTYGINSQKEVPLSDKPKNEQLENKILEEKISKEETLHSEKLEDNISLIKNKVDISITTNEISITTEETKIVTSNEVKESITVENAVEISSEPMKNETASTDYKNNTVVVCGPSTSKEDQIDIHDVTTISESQHITEKPKDITENSEANSNIASIETEIQKSEVSNKVEDSKNSISTAVSTSSNENVSQNAIKDEITKETDNFKMMAPVTSAAFPEKSKKIGTPSTIVPAKTEEVTSTTSFPDNSKIVEATSSTTGSDNSKTVEATSSATVSVNSKTIEPTSNTTSSDNSKAVEVTSSETLSDDVKSVQVASSSTVPDNLKTVEATPNTSVLDKSKMASSSNSTASGISNTTASSSSSNSKATEASTSRTTLDISNETVSSSRTVTDVEPLSKAMKEMDKDSKSSSVQQQDGQHSKIPDTSSADTPLTDKLSTPASTASQPENIPLKRTVSEESSTSQAIKSDDVDSQDSSDDSRPSSVTPPSPVDALRSRFEGLAGGSVRGGPIRPASPFRRMSFNSRKQVIALEKKRDVSLDKPWFHQKVVPEPAKIPKPKRTIKQQLEMERKVRKMVSDRKVRTYRKAEIVVQLMDMNFEEDEAIQAANECSTLEQAISYLQQECLLCTGNFPVNQIVSMTHCQHRACRECIRAYFTVQIRDRTILDLLCPFCNEPDIGDEDVAQDYFNHLDLMLKKLVDNEIHELFQRKLRDRVLMKDPNFRWCSQCSSGFISEPNLKRLICPDCNAITCASCRRLWEKDHQGISCEAFAALKDASDPEAQAAGLAKLLTEDGIDCPSCHFRYALAKGGCMHFRCIQCQHDFCSGCSRPFKMGQKCGVSEFCSKLGLHAHHPRNCLFYLRDKEPEDLQKLLDMNDVKYNREPPEGMELRNTCQVMEQKETSDGMVDDYCGKEVQDGYAGLCRVHYVEYLGQLVNKNQVDPIQIFDNDDLELVLRRANIRLPPKRYRETDEQYREKLVNLIQDELPLDKMDGS